MKTILALFFALSLVITPLAVAGGLGSADSDFMFGDVQEATAVTISPEEMEGTAAQLLTLLISVQTGDINILNDSIKNILNGSNLLCVLLATCVAG